MPEVHEVSGGKALRVLWQLSIDDTDPSEEVFKLQDLLFNHRVVLLLSGLFHHGSDLCDLVKSVPTSVALHAMAESLNGSEVVLSESGSKCSEIVLSVL